MAENRYRHVPVLAEGTAERLVWYPAGIYVDGTIGGGGHTAAILNRLSPEGRVIGIDRDPDAVAAATARFAEQTGQVTVIHGDYAHLPAILERYALSGVDGLLLDLGVSSYQLDAPARGFSFMSNGPLDMRMNPEDGTTAADVVNGAAFDDLVRIISTFGEERLARPIAQAIVRSRQRSPIQTTLDLVAVLRPVVGHRPLYKTCARVFQAFRIAVNEELDRLRGCLASLTALLRPHGRLGIISYHSLEDRIVKHTFQAWARGCVCPPGLPQCVCGQRPVVSMLTRRPICPTEQDIRVNPRARSAKLRMVERLPDASLTALTT
jgi:16S rRNA (cytosine1402-N4)-methyltransferase